METSGWVFTVVDSKRQMLPVKRESVMTPIAKSPGVTEGLEVVSGSCQAIARRTGADKVVRWTTRRGTGRQTPIPTKAKRPARRIRLRFSGHPRNVPHPKFRILTRRYT